MSLPPYTLLGPSMLSDKERNDIIDWLKKEILGPCQIPSDIDPEEVVERIWRPIYNADIRSNEDETRVLRSAIVKLHGDLRRRDSSLPALKMLDKWPKLPACIWSGDIDFLNGNEKRKNKDRGLEPAYIRTARQTVPRKRRLGPEGDTRDERVDEFLRTCLDSHPRKDRQGDPGQSPWKRSRTQSNDHTAFGHESGKKTQQPFHTQHNNFVGRSRYNKDDNALFKSPQEISGEYMKESLVKSKAQLEHLQKCERDLMQMTRRSDAEMELAGRSQLGIQVDLEYFRERISAVQKAVDERLDAVFGLLGTKDPGGS
ncbi:MAG: hypothetical protein LQ340_007770 [Diploschistes diacapsis]|nr:MAG: hypothetical protein LQ340_007770 [Diploschistes diacapsis]